jgi:hypothetical protein
VTDQSSVNAIVKPSLFNSAERRTRILRRVGYAAAFIILGVISSKLHSPLVDSCEPECSSDVLAHGNFRLQAAAPLVYINTGLLYLVAFVAGIGALFWQPLSRRPGRLLLLTILLLVLVDSWLMRYW